MILNYSDFSKHKHNPQSNKQSTDSPQYLHKRFRFRAGDHVVLQQTRLSRGSTTLKSLVVVFEDGPGMHSPFVVIITDHNYNWIPVRFVDIVDNGTVQNKAQRRSIDKKLARVFTVSCFNSTLGALNK